MLGIESNSSSDDEVADDATDNDNPYAYFRFANLNQAYKNRVSDFTRSLY